QVFSESSENSLGLKLNILQSIEDDKHNHVYVLIQTQTGLEEHHITGKLTYLEFYYVTN
ncbi:hypothetical protein HispidOSU_025469, partial [Sigmodon hispidus]